MFGKFFKLFGNQGVGSTSSGSETQNRDQMISVVKEKWAYQHLFTKLPEMFYSDMNLFLENVNIGFSQAKWTHHQLNEQLSAYILVFDPSKPRLTDNKALMAAAIYSSSTNTPLEFYVLIENPMGIRIRQVDSELSSWAIRNGLEPVTCNPDLGSFIDFLRLKTQQASD